MRMMKRVLAMTVPACFLIVSAVTASSTSSSVWLPDGFVYPNGIAFVGDGEQILAGSVTSGDIVSITRQGEASIVFRETDQRFAGTALRYDPDNGKIWVASPDFLGQEIDGEIRRRPHRLAVMSAVDGEVEWSAEMPDGGFPNDIALDGLGGAFVTDSINGRVFHISEPGASLRIIVDELESRDGPLGPAGIATAQDGSLIVGMYSDGRLLRVAHRAKGTSSTEVTDIPLAQQIANPDGMVFGPDGRLLVIDGGVVSGNGRLVAVDLSKPAPHPVEVLLSGLELPVNLAIRDDLLAITESRIRHLMLEDLALPVPNRFRVIFHELDVRE